MTLPSSGSITFAQIATELGRTGTSVSLNQADVAALAGKTTSSQIIVPNDFWGKSASDYTPDAVDWANITGSNGQFGHTNASKSITGINPSIVLRPTLSNLTTSGGFLSGGEIRAHVGVTPTVLWTYNGGTTNNTITVSNNDTVYFSASVDTSGATTVFLSCTVSVVNTSDSNATIDTFTINISRAGGPGA